MVKRISYFVVFNVLTEDGLSYTRNAHISLDTPIKNISHVRAIEKWLCDRVQVNDGEVNVLSWTRLDADPNEAQE